MVRGFLIARAAILRKISGFYWSAIYAGYRAIYGLHPTFRFNGHGILFYGEGTIAGGANSYIGELSTVQAVDGCSVTFGARCQISHNVRVYTQTTVADADFASSEPLPQKRGNVTFGDFCWVGANVFIGPGVSIGQNAVVGANSVVTKDIPACEIWGGVPARRIRKKRGI